jgi:HEAT repeat protein
MRFRSRCCVLALALPASLAGQDPPRDPVLEAARELALTAAERVQEQSRAPLALEGVSFAEQGTLTRLREFGPAAAPLLRAVMTERDSSHVTRSASAFALATLDAAQADAATAVLVEQVHAMGFSAQQVAPSLLVALGERAVPELVRHVDDPMVVVVLADMRADARAAVPALIARLEGGRLDVAAALAEIGVDAGIEAARPVLARALEDENWQTVRTALYAIAELRGRGGEFIPRILELRDHPVAEVRLAAAVALADLGAMASAVPALERIALDTTVHDRYAAVRKLWALGPAARPAAAGLLRIVQDEEREPGERAAAVVALARIAPNGAQYRTALQVAAADERLRSLVETDGVVLPNP